MVDFMYTAFICGSPYLFFYYDEAIWIKFP